MCVVARAAGGLSFGGWLLVGLGLLVDLGTYGGGAFGNKDNIQTYYR